MRSCLPSASWTRRAARAACVGIGSAALATVWLSGPARAQQARPRKGSAVVDGGAFGARAGSTTPVAAPLATGAADAGVAYAAAGDAGAHVFKFTELDIEGRLKTPQLVYFLRRVRAEFTAEELGHRSFFREMSETRKEQSF
jgi:hypothetical protein